MIKIKKYRIAIYLFLIIIALSIQVSAQYNYFRTITINSSAVSGSHTDFPMLFSGTYSYLANVNQSGGNVSHLLGYDIGFYSSSSCTSTSILSWEIEQYNETTGTITAWIKISNISNLTSTIIYLCYFDNSISTFQSNISAVWDQKYVGVWHLSDTDSTYISESTSNPNLGTKKSSTEPRYNSSGKIGGGQTFDGINDVINVSDHNSLDSTQNITISGWINSNSWDNAYGHHLINKEGNYYLRTGDNAATEYDIGWFEGSDLVRSSAAPPSTNTWHHIVGIAMNNYAYEIYVNGVAVGGVPSYWFTVGRDLTQELTIGGVSAGDPSFNGTIDEARVSNQVLLPSWILTEYNNQAAPTSFYSIGDESVLTSTFIQPIQIYGFSTIYGLNTIFRH